MTPASGDRAIPPAAMTPVPLPAQARAASGLARIDYSDAFLLDAGIEWGPERWARAMIEGAPLATRVRLLSAWISLGLRLGPPWAADRVLGWKMQENQPESVLLTADSWLGLKAELFFHAQPRGVLFTTLIQQDNALARSLWRMITPTHQAVVQSLLRHAARRQTDGLRA